MNLTALALVSTVIGSGALGVTLTALFNRRKTIAEARKISVEADVNVGTSWRDYAIQAKKDMDDLKAELHETNVCLAELRATIAEKDKHIDSLTKILQNRNPDLEITLRDIRDFMSRLLANSNANTGKISTILENTAPAPAATA